MQIRYQNLKKGEIKVKIDNLDDLWYLSHIIDIGDLIRGHTIRKIKIGGEGDRKVQVTKKKVFITVKLEKIEFQDDLLKLLGKITHGSEYIQKGSHHSFNIEEGTIISIIKEKWLKYQLDKIKEAAKTEQPSILICILDREEAMFALSKRKGYEILSSIKGEVQKKEDNVISKGSFYHDIIKTIEEYVSRYKIKNIIVASPAFWKEELLKHIKDNKIKEKIVLATCSSVSNNAVDEVLRRPEVREILKQVRTSKEMNLVEEFLRKIAKNEPSAYGFKEVNKAGNAGAVKILIVTDKFIHKIREKEKYEELDEIMKIIDSTKGEIHIISSEHEAGKKLDGLGGVGAILRYRIN